MLVEIEHFVNWLRRRNATVRIEGDAGAAQVITCTAPKAVACGASVADEVVEVAALVHSDALRSSEVVTRLDASAEVLLVDCAKSVQLLRRDSHAMT